MEIGKNMTEKSGLLLDRYKIWDAITADDKNQTQNHTPFYLILSLILVLFLVAFLVKIKSRDQSTHFRAVKYSVISEKH
jgi:hypothetical protein